MKKERNVLKGTAAGLVGGLGAAFIMTWFMSGPGSAVEEVVDRRLGKPVGPTQNGVNAAKKVASTVSSLTTGSPLSAEQQKTAVPILHVTFSSFAGAAYGALAEISPAARSGLGAGFGTTLFALVGVPSLKLGQDEDALKPGELISSLASHVVYGVSTELIRRTVRKFL